MKTILRTATILAIGCTVALSSCVKKDLTEDSNNILNNLKDESYYRQNGSITGSFAGNLTDFSGYTTQKYSESRKFSFVDDNFDRNPSNYMTTKKYTSASTSGAYEFTLESYYITMFSTDGSTKTDRANKERISIQFKIYKGKISQEMTDAGIKTDAPEEILVAYKLVYTPDKKIDVLYIDGSLGFKTNYNNFVTKKEEIITITDFKFNPESGSISFLFSGVDSDDSVNNEKITEGKVDTKILLNNILKESDNDYD